MIARRTIAILVFGASALFAQDQQKSLDALDEQMRAIAGPRALNCGGGNISDRKKSNSCALRMSDQGMPFFIRLDGLKFDTEPDAAVGLALNTKGTMYFMIYREVSWTKRELGQCRKGAKLAGQGKVIVETCPQPNKLFVTQMQSLTCFPPSPDNQPNW